MTPSYEAGRIMRAIALIEGVHAELSRAERNSANYDPKLSGSLDPMTACIRSVVNLKWALHYLHEGLGIAPNAKALESVRDELAKSEAE